MTVYNYWKKGPVGGLEIDRILLDTVKTGGVSTDFTSKVIDLGLGYRKQEMLEDFRRAVAIEVAHDLEARSRAEWWFENVFEPLRKKKGWNANQTTTYLQKAETGLLENIEDYEDYEEGTTALHSQFPDIS